jgi:hypothetical protein
MVCCLHCALRSFVKNRGEIIPGTESGIFDETPEVHMHRMHPHGVDRQERVDLERQATAIIEELTRQNAENN